MMNQRASKIDLFRVITRVSLGKSGSFPSSRFITGVGIRPITTFHSSVASVSGSSQKHKRDLSMFSKFPDRVKLTRLRTQMEASPTEATMYEYVRTLVSVDPHDAISFIERGWSAGKVPVNEVYMKEYFRAAGELKKIDSLNITGLLELLRRSQRSASEAAAAGDGAGAVTREELSSIMAPASGGGGRMGFGAGSSPLEPLYVARQDRSWKSELWSVARTAVGLFIFFSFVGTFFDEKATGGAAAGSISSRLGLGSAVHRVEKSDKTFNDVVGIDEAKGDLEEIVWYLKDPKKFTRLGGRLPKGVLLTGPPGTGKTLLARAIAGEANVPFFHASGSEFEEMYVGVGAKRVRELFEVAKTKSPCIIFIDEIDAIGGSRHVKDQSAMKMTLNQLLVEMDGFQQNSGVIVIAATNFPDSLDKALVRPGRFDKHVDVPMPDIGGRKAILELYSKKIPMDKDVDLEQLARGTPGFSGADLFNLMNQAALKASLDNFKSVTMGALEYAKDKIMMGAERKSAVISEETMRTTAFHEAGHALVALLTDGADPIHKATIMPRGRALGMVMQLPDGDQTSMSRKQMIARLDICMGGRVAEELVFGEDAVTSGASNDIMQATRLAKAMVTKYGFSSKVGVVFVDEKGKQSGRTQGDIDDEVKELLQNSYERAKALLTKHRAELELVAKGLMEYESLAGSEIVDIIKGKPPAAGAKRSQKPSRATKVLPVPRSGASGPASPTGGTSGTSSGGPPSGGQGGAAGKKVAGVSARVHDTSTSSPAAAGSGSGSPRNAVERSAAASAHRNMSPITPDISAGVANSKTTLSSTTAPVVPGSAPGSTDNDAAASAVPPRKPTSTAASIFSMFSGGKNLRGDGGSSSGSNTSAADAVAATPLTTPSFMAKATAAPPSPTVSTSSSSTTSSKAQAPASASAAATANKELPLAPPAADARRGNSNSVHKPAAATATAASSTASNTASSTMGKGSADR